MAPVTRPIGRCRHCDRANTRIYPHGLCARCYDHYPIRLQYAPPRRTRKPRGPSCATCNEPWPGLVRHNQWCPLCILAAKLSSRYSKGRRPPRALRPHLIALYAQQAARGLPLFDPHARLEPRAESLEPGAESQEPRAKSQEPRAESLENGNNRA